MKYARLALIATIIGAALELGGCAFGGPIPAKLECTGICAVGGTQAISRCKAQTAQTVQVKPFSYRNFYTGQIETSSISSTPRYAFRNCLNGEGWEYLPCASEQEQDCLPINKSWVSENNASQNQ